MDDQTRGETSGNGPGSDVPLKRDRQRLRSSEPWPTRKRTPAAPPEPAATDEPEELREPGLSSVEQLFASQWTSQAPAIGAPASTKSPQPVASPPAGSRPRHDDDVEPGSNDPTGEPPARSSSVARPSTGLPVQGKTVPYVPPGGFTSPGHPQLGPLAPVPVEHHRGLASLDIAALVAAVVVPPIGLVTAIVAISRGKKVRGWASDLARAAVSVALVMTIVFAGVGGYIWVQETERAEQLAAVKAEQRAHSLIETASQPFCEVLAANPAIYSTADPDYGWPAVDAPGGYNSAIAAYAQVWAQLAEVAPEGIAAETATISERVAEIVSISNALGSSNRAGDLLGLHAETDLATVESWYVEYCDAPDVVGGVGSSGG